MQISKENARKVANQLTKNKRELLKNEYSNFNKKVEIEFLKTIPFKLINFYNENPKLKDYFNLKDCIQLIGNGFNYEYIYLENEIPLSSNKFNNPPNFLVIEFNKLEKQNDKIKELEDEIYNSLLTLKTYSNIKEQFNEAYLLLPQKENLPALVNVSKIRKQLK